MDTALLHQLWELAEAFNRIGLQPVIGGGLGLYLLFREQSHTVRATQDIDLIVTGAQAGQRAMREAMGRAVIDELHYVVRDDSRCFRFTKEPAQQLDLLAPLLEGIAIEGGRVKLIRTKLHARFTPEACFIEEDLRTVDVALLVPGSSQTGPLFVNVPSPANMLILKLFAFDDRDSVSRRDEERAQAHAYDVYLISALTQLSDFRQGREFLHRHEASEVVRNAREIVRNKFLTLEHPGWRYVLSSAAFLPGRPIGDRQKELDVARRRLLRWFEEYTSTRQITPTA